MGVKQHAPFRSRKKDVIVTTALCAAVFGAALFLQAQQYARCRSFTSISSVGQLQEYVQTFIEGSDPTGVAAGNLEEVSKQLRETIDNNTRLATQQQEATDLQDKLNTANSELAIAKQRISTLESELKDLTTAKEEVTTLTSKVEQHTKDLESNKQQVQQLTQQKEQLEKDKEQLEKDKEQLEKDKQQLEKDKQKLEQQQGKTTGTDSAAPGCKLGLQPLIGNPNTSTPAINTARQQALAVAGAQCTPIPDIEFNGDPIPIFGYDHRAADAAECCAACHAHRQVVARGGTDQGKNGETCSLWSFCSDAEKCGKRLGECWLRGLGKTLKELPPAPEVPKNTQKADGWVSGIVYGDDSAHLAAYNNTALVWNTSLGQIEIELLPELAPASVRELRRAASILAPSGFCSNCKIYRPEKGFLVQGVLEAPGVYVATPRHPNPKQRMVMERGLVCWAGGSGGPHWFVNMIDQSGFKDDHLCFGLVKNMTVLEAILELPLAPKQEPNDMNGLLHAVYYNVTLKKLQPKQ